MVTGWPSSASICRMWFLILPVLVGAGLVVAGAEVGEPGGGVSEQVPDDDQDGPGDGDLGLGLAAAAGDPPVALAEERVRAGGAGGGLAEGPRSHLSPWPFFPARVRGPDWRADGHSPAQDTRWAAVGNRDISRPVSAMMARARSALMPGISASRAPRAARGVRAGAGVRAGGPVAVDAPGGGHRRGQPGDPGGELGDRAGRGRRSGPAASRRARRGGHRTCRPGPRPGRRAWPSSGRGPGRPAPAGRVRRRSWP